MTFLRRNTEKSYLLRTPVFLFLICQKGKPKSDTSAEIYVKEQQVNVKNIFKSYKGCTKQLFKNSQTISSYLNTAT